MADEPVKLILGDTAISAIEQPAPRKSFFRRKKRQSPPPTHCENCGALLYGRWCAQCGQPAIDYRRSIRHVIADLLDEFLNWDSKFFTTIGLLMARPWKLTNQFLAGHRVRYVHPLRVYLLASVLFFFAINFWAKSIHLNRGKLSPKDQAEIQADLKNPDVSPEAKAAIQHALAFNGLSPSPAPTTTGRSAEKSSATPAEKPTPTAEPVIQFGSKTPSSPFEKWLETRAKEKIGEHGTKAELFLTTVISNLPYMMLCCIPLFAFVLKILYIRRRIFYIDHLVYALHIHSFTYLSVILITLTGMGLSRSAPNLTAPICNLLALVVLVQILLSIRRVYRQGWFLSVVKFLFGGFVYLFVLLMALVTTFFVTLALP
jgi:Protein of unknown function (DUF3667)